MGTTDTNKTKILVIDDDPRVLEVLIQTLERDGFEAEGVESAGQGFSRYMAAHFDVLMVDEALYAVDGLRLIRLIRLLDQRTTLLMVSGVADLPTAVSALRYGADDYISKPFKVWDLKDRIVTSMNRRSIVARKHQKSASADGDKTKGDGAGRLKGLDLPEEQKAFILELLPRIECRVLEWPGFGAAVRDRAVDAARKLSVRESDLEWLGHTAELQVIGFGGQDPPIMTKALSGAQEWRDSWRGFALESAELLDSVGTGALQCGRLLRSTADLATEHFRKNGNDAPHTLEQVLWAATFWTASEKWTKGQPANRADPAKDTIGEIEQGAGIKLDPSVATAFLTAPG